MYSVIPKYFFCKNIFFTTGPFINFLILYFLIILNAILNDCSMKAFDLDEDYQADWQPVPDEEAVAQAEEPADSSGLINAIQQIDPSVLHPDPQIGPQMLDNAIAAVNLMASNRDVRPTQGQALLKALQLIIS